MVAAGCCEVLLHRTSVFRHQGGLLEALGGGAVQPIGVQVQLRSPIHCADHAIIELTLNVI
jgi:hypothetical protein